MIQLKLWLQWVIVSATGWILGLVSVLVVHFTIIGTIKYLIYRLHIISDLQIPAFNEVMLDNIGDAIPGDFIGIKLALIFGVIFGVLKGAIFGSIGGLSQYLILRKYISNPKSWIFINALAWASLWGAIWGIVWGWGWRVAIKITSVEMFYGLLGATGFGLLGWLFLRSRLTSAHWWVVATVITWFISRSLVLNLGARLMGFPLDLLWYLVGIGNGVITGGVLVWLMKISKQKVYASPVN